MKWRRHASDFCNWGRRLFWRTATGYCFIGSDRLNCPVPGGNCRLTNVIVEGGDDREPSAVQRWAAAELRGIKHSSLCVEAGRSQAVLAKKPYRCLQALQ